MISVEHLTKCYGDFMAVDDLSFEIEEGQVPTARTTCILRSRTERPYRWIPRVWTAICRLSESWI